MLASALLSFWEAEQVLSLWRDYAASAIAVLVLPGYPKYLGRLGARRFLLAALRVQAAYRRIAEATGACPALAAFETSPLKERRKDPASGLEIAVVALGSGTFSLEPPLPLNLRKSGEPDDPPNVVIVCPNTANQSGSVRRRAPTP